jgi:hypothetical protein
VVLAVSFVGWVVYSNNSQRPPEPAASSAYPDHPVDPEKARALERERAEQERVSEQRRTEQERAAIEAATVEAVDLCAAYAANQVRADLAYKGRSIYVRGVVTEIGVTLGDTPYVFLSGPDGPPGVQCTFAESDKSELANVQKGQTLTISGRCDGKTMAWVLVEDSRIAVRE